MTPTTPFGAVAGSSSPRADESTGQALCLDRTPRTPGAEGRYPNNAGGIQPMTEQREAELLAHVRTLTTLAEADNFRRAITKDETIGGALYRALMARIDYLAHKEGRA